MKHLVALAMLSLIGSSVFSMNEAAYKQLLEKARQRGGNSTKPRPVIVLPQNDAEGLEQAKQTLRNQGTVELPKRHQAQRKLSQIGGNKLINLSEQYKDCLIGASGCVAWLAILLCWYWVNPLFAQDA